MNNNNKEFIQSLTVTMLLIALIVPASLHSSVISSPEEAFALKYDKTQAASETNECGNGEFPLSVLCQSLALKYRATKTQ